MALSERLAIIITANGAAAVSEFKKVEASATRDLGKADTAAAKFKANWTRIAAGMAVVGAAVAAGLRVAVDEAAEAAVVGRQTDAVIKSTGGSANVTKAHLEDLAGALSKVAAVDDEVIQSAGNVMLTFKAVRNEVGEGNDIFDRAIESALDMSAALGTDLQAASLQLGKALANPVQGLTALRRAGVDFTAQQQDQIRTMVAMGDTLGAQRVIMDEVESQFAGSSEAAATGFARLEVAWGNLMEKLGTPVNNWFEQFARDIEDPMAKIEEWTRLSLAGSIWETFNPPDTLDGIGTIVGELADVSSASEAAAGSVDDVSSAVEDLTEAIDIYLSGTFDLPEAQRELGESFATLSEAMTAGESNWNEQAEAMQGVVEQTAEVISIMSEQGASQQAVDDKMRSSIQVLRQMRDTGVITGDQFVTLRDQILAIPHGTETRVKTPGAREAQDNMRTLKADIERVPGRKGVQVELSGGERAILEARSFKAQLDAIPRTVTVQAKFFGAALPKYAGGTESAARGLALVGERGPELVAFAGGERVWSAGESRRMMSGGSAVAVGGTTGPSIVVNVHGKATAADGQEVVDALKRWSKSNGPVPVKVSA